MQALLVASGLPCTMSLSCEMLVAIEHRLMFLSFGVEEALVVGFSLYVYFDDEEGSVAINEDGLTFTLM